ncbi:hypothetical protein PUR34_02530 [Streptomyces sp. JV185]|uniref:hypothetical protein n=1 Tax=Streptomyces sp. JV185 TaxID=858638 RepID=UPI002E797AFE|nr:hypothetical protein [Streptomyces sp. JV185]MEE1767088.1 hypothetical protein [Streptomyces sp. JV185]
MRVGDLDGGYLPVRGGFQVPPADGADGQPAALAAELIDGLLDAEQTLCVYNVEPGSETAQALRVLASWTVPGITSPAVAPRPGR